MKYRILGSLEAEADGNRVTVGGPREQALLAVLLLNANRVVQPAQLVDALWDEDPPATAVKQVRNAVSRLRGLLAAGEDSHGLVTDGAGYRLIVGEGMLDAALFEERIRKAAASASAGQVAKAAELLESALDLWRGPALAGVPGQAIGAAARAWNERRCTAAETYYDHQIALGRHREILVELSALATDHPLRERPTAQLMLALYRCGRRADALALFAGTRRLLADEMGLDPSQELQRLHQRILTADPALTMPRTARDEGSRAPLAVAVPRQLPAAIRHFTGRRDELKALSSLLDEARQRGGTAVISAIGGTAGIGKTALAVHWAHQVADQFPDGQFYVNLRGFEPAGRPVEPAEVIRGLLAALGVPLSQTPATPDAYASLYRTLLADRRMLIVLDNARDADQVRPLLPGTARCFVVVTSRNQLTSLVAAEGAEPLTLGLLSDSEAQELLARRLGPQRMTAEAPVADELITICARLPLALSIAVGRAASQPMLTLADLVAELRDTRSRLDALNAGDAAADVRTVFSSSYQNLSSAAARMFRLLGVHPGPDISAPAAASLAGIPPAQAHASMAELTRAHLLTEHFKGRYALHDLLRAYAAERARAHDSEAERHAALYRDLDHYLHTAHSAALLLDPTRDPLPLAAPRPGVRPDNIGADGQALAWFEAEYPVLLAAAARAADAGFDTHAWQLPWTVADFFDRRGRWPDYAATLSAALAAAQRGADLDGQARTHASLSRAYGRLGSYSEAVTHAQEALGVYRRLGDRAGQARSHLSLSVLSDCLGRGDEALDHDQQALSLYQAAGHRAGQADALNAVGWDYAQSGDYERSLALCEQALALHHELGNRRGEADTWDSLGYAHHELGQHALAQTCYRRALDLFRDLGDRLCEAEVLTHSGDAQHSAGDQEAAMSTWQQALAILDDLHRPEAEQVRAKLRWPTQ
jgi:DNA-binding SARP family transcriptional activator